MLVLLKDNLSSILSAACATTCAQGKGDSLLSCSISRAYLSVHNGHDYNGTSHMYGGTVFILLMVDKQLPFNINTDAFENLLIP